MALWLKKDTIMTTTLIKTEIMTTILHIHACMHAFFLEHYLYNHNYNNTYRCFSHKIQSRASAAAHVLVRSRMMEGCQHWHKLDQTADDGPKTRPLNQVSLSFSFVADEWSQPNPIQPNLNLFLWPFSVPSLFVVTVCLLSFFLIKNSINGTFVLISSRFTTYKSSL